MTGNVTRAAPWIALALLAAMNLMNYYDRLLVVVLSQPLRVEFSLSDTQYALLTGPAFVLVYAVASLLFGRLADSHGRRWLIAFVIALWSGMTALCGFAKSFALLAMARAGVGIGEGGANPAGMSLLSDHFPPQRRSLALALFQVGGNIGMLASFMAASWIAAHHGWRAAFWVGAVPGLVLAVLIFCFMPDAQRGQYDGETQAPIPFARTMAQLWHNKAYVWLCWAASFGVFSSLGMLIWLPQYFIRLHGMDQAQVGFLFGPAASFGLIIGMVIGGWLGNRLAVRHLAAPVWLCIAANLLLVPVLLTMLWSRSTSLALLACFIGMGLAVVYAPAFQATMQSVCAPRQRGMAGACSNVLNALIGQGLIPLFVGMVSDGLMPALGAQSLRWALTAATGFTLVSGLLFILAYRHARRLFDERSSPP
ncbi:MFS transporter [Sphingobium sp. EM0848]|uniref:spinster family MFS transporter n=1 Tax=Sphingobium sp. EM0848 TaxID=2743473 RepID=UPI00159C687B|nr:MFS transporter [Sphingobium sp. EM0848]